MSDKKGTITTRYDSPDAGTMAFDRNEEVDAEIVDGLNIVRQIRSDYKDHPQVLAGLEGIEGKLQNLRFSKEPAETIREQLQALMQVPLGEDQSLRLDFFRKSSGGSKVADEDAYLEQVRKMIKNTINNAALLLLHFPGDPVLTRMVEDLQALEITDYRTVKAHMQTLGKSPQLWKYNEKKKAFLVEWLKPFEQELGKPIAQLSEEEFQAALAKVLHLRDQKLEEMTHLMVDADRAPFRPNNRAMNPIINGKDETFWGGAEARDEFIALMNKLITRFSFNLEDRFLIFRTKDGGFCYLIGFADEAFDQAVTTSDGKLGLYPHLKVFIKHEEDDYAEITQEFCNGNAKLFYTTLKTAVVPFLRAAAVMVEAELSDEIKTAFDMWT